MYNGEYHRQTKLQAPQPGCDAAGNEAFVDGCWKEEASINNQNKAVWSPDCHLKCCTKVSYMYNSALAG